MKVQKIKSCPKMIDKKREKIKMSILILKYVLNFYNFLEMSCARISVSG